MTGSRGCSVGPVDARGVGVGFGVGFGSAFASAS